MNSSAITDTITDLTDRLPSRADAASTIASTFDDVADRLHHQLPDVDLPDVSEPVRRSRRAVARVVPGMSASRLDSVRDRASIRWTVVAAIAVAAVAAVIVLRRRSRTQATEQRRDDWMTTPSGNSRPADDDAREPVGTRT